MLLRGGEKRPNDWPEPFFSSEEIRKEILSFRTAASVKRCTDLLAKISGERVEQNHWTEDNRAFSQVLQNAVRP